MIVFSLYLLILCFIIYKTSVFGLLKDNVLNPKFYLSAFLIKILAIGAFYLLYMKLYGTIYYSDTGNFYRDSKIIHNIAFSNFGEFFKLMFGFQDDGAGSYIYENFLKPTTTWDKTNAEVLYNDNRLILRMHALIHFISFGNYAVHALFSCFLSFIGIHWIYKTFKPQFVNKEIYFFLIWVLFPGVWFWTSGLFKEGPALFLLGMLLISLKRVIAERKYSFKNLIMLFIVLQLAVVFKSYLMLPVLLATIVFYGVKNRTDIKVSLKYLVWLIIVFLVTNLTLKLVFEKDCVKLLAGRQKTFLDVSSGGIFLAADGKYLRIAYDYSLVKLDSSQAEVKGKINFGVPYTYWNEINMADTLICEGNTDTSKIYTLIHVIPKQNSTFTPVILVADWWSFIKSIPYSLCVAAFKPFFYDARNTMDLISSVENLIILLFVLLFIYNGVKRNFRNPYFIYFLSMAVMVLIVIGITSPNLGAMQRYRALIVPFILLTALLSSTIKDHPKLSNFFKN